MTPHMVEALAAQVGSLSAANRRFLVETALPQLGVGVSYLEDLRDPEVLAVVAKNPDLSRRIGDAVSSLEKRVILERPPKETIFPSWMTGLYRNTSPPLWRPPSTDFRMEREIRAASVRRHGKLVYPKSSEEEQRLKAKALEYNQIGKPIRRRRIPHSHHRELLGWLGVQPVPRDRPIFHLDLLPLGYRLVEREAPRPGDLVSYPADILRGLGILTKVSPEAVPIEVLMPMGLYHFVVHPDYPGTQRTVWRQVFSPPDYLIVRRPPYSTEKEEDPPRVEELKEVEKAIQFPPGPFGVLFHGEGSGLFSKEWAVSYDFANGDYAIFHLLLSGEGGDRELSVIIDYYQSLDEDPPDFAGEAEEVLEEAARRLGIAALNLFYKLTPRDPSGEFKAELERRGYKKGPSPGWGRLLGKRIIFIPPSGFFC